LQFREDRDGLALEENGAVVRWWSRTELEGAILSGLANGQPLRNSGENELVVCENTMINLLVCQAAGYAAARRVPIVFLPSVETNREPPDEWAFEAVRARAEAMVPLTIRQPQATTLTVFTDFVPLHLVRTRSDAEWPRGYWATEFRIAHLPGQCASMLVPRHFATLTAASSGSRLAIAFNSLGVAGEESMAIADSLRSALSNVLVLDDIAASGAALAGALRFFQSDLLVLSAHGERNGIRARGRELIEDSLIEGWHLNGHPLVINNSCTSLSGTGPSFLKAGARGYIGTLWEVRNQTAAAVGWAFSLQLRSNPQEDAAGAMGAAVRHSAGDLAEPADTGAYVYFGLPGVDVRAEQPLNKMEQLNAASLAYYRLYETLNAMTVAGLGAVARLLHGAARQAVARGFEGLIQPGETPLHLPSPFAGTVLDLDFLLATSDFHLRRAIMKTLPPDHQVEMGMLAAESIDQAVSELSGWKDRYTAHYAFGHDRAEAGRLAAGHVSDFSMYRMLARTACDACLPLAADLADLLLVRDAWRMVSLASVMVTTRDDLEGNTSAPPSVVRERIRKGVPHAARTYNPGHEPGGPVEFDLLSNAVSRSELANRFGIAFRHLKAETEVLAFYQLALELAEPGSPEYQNAISNLSALTDDANSLARALLAQEQSGDIGNMITTGTNWLRSSARSRDEVSQSIVEKLESAAGRLESTEARFFAGCDVQGALSVYYASQARDGEALACVHAIGAMLIAAASHRTTGLGPAVVHLRELLQWYDDRQNYWRVCEVGPVVAGYLQRANLASEEVRVRIVTASSAGMAYNRIQKQMYLETLLEQSAATGRILRHSAELERELSDWIPTLRENTLNAWQHVQKRGPVELALLAYETHLAWPGGTRLDAWEWVRAAYSPANTGLVADLARVGDLRRSIRVTIDNDLRETIAVVNTHAVSSGHDVVFCTWPIKTDLHAGANADDRIVHACGIAVIKVRSGDEVELRELSSRHLYGDGKMDYVYADSWGSSIFDYDFVIEFPPRFIPLHIELTASNVAMTSGLAIRLRGLQSAHLPCGEVRTRNPSVEYSCTPLFSGCRTSRSLVFWTRQSFSGVDSL
jgi:hypothetical protein